jgi:hypothetical protein
MRTRVKVTSESANAVAKFKVCCNWTSQDDEYIELYNQLYDGAYRPTSFSVSRGSDTTVIAAYVKDQITGEWRKMK